MLSLMILGSRLVYGFEMELKYFIVFVVMDLITFFIGFGIGVNVEDKE